MIRLCYRTIAALIILLFWTASVSAQTETDPETELALMIGDKIQISVDRFPRYSGIYEIEQDGSIEHPLLGVVPAAEQTLGEFETTLYERFSVYLKRPRVKVAFAGSAAPGAVEEESETFPVYLMGEIPSPGTFRAKPGMTILQVIAMAGGVMQHPKKDVFGNIITTGANTRAISVFRADGSTYQINLDQIQKTGDQTQNIPLQPGDTVYIPAGSEQNFTVLGQVKNPGSYPIQDTLPLMDALVEAGGLTLNGSLRNIRIVRGGSDDPQTLRVNLWDLLKGGRVEAIPEVQSGDSIFVDFTPIYHWNRFVSSLRGAARSSESIRVIRDFDDRTGAGLEN
jgi:polysaccharide biosynthesis/export protein